MQLRPALARLRALTARLRGARIRLLPGRLPVDSKRRDRPMQYVCRRPPIYSLRQNRCSGRGNGEFTLLPQQHWRKRSKLGRIVQFHMQGPDPVDPSKTRPSTVGKFALTMAGNQFGPTGAVFHTSGYITARGGVPPATIAGNSFQSPKTIRWGGGNWKTFIALATMVGSFVNNRPASPHGMALATERCSETLCTQKIESLTALVRSAGAS